MSDKHDHLPLCVAPTSFALRPTRFTPEQRYRLWERRQEVAWQMRGDVDPILDSHIVDEVLDQLSDQYSS